MEGCPEEWVDAVVKLLHGMTPEASVHSGRSQVRL